MTCIVALKQNNQIYMGCDSASVNGYNLASKISLTPKISRIKSQYNPKNVLIGYTTSWRMGQILSCAFKIPRVLV